MPRDVRYRLVLPGLGPITNGRFLHPRESSEDWYGLSRAWVLDNGYAITPVSGRPLNSALLKKNDVVSIVVWTQSNQAGEDDIQSIQLAVVIGRDSHSIQQRASPFGLSQPKCVFLSTMQPAVGAGSVVLNPRGGRALKQYIARLDRIEVSDGHYEFMIGAIVTMKDGTTYEFGHDPECDVGMEGN